MPYYYLLGLVGLLLPAIRHAEAEAATPALEKLDLTNNWAGYFSLVVMVAAYIAVMFEDMTELRKPKPMLLAAALIWFVIVLAYQQQGNDLLAVTSFKSNLQSYIELLLFIMVSMTYLNAMEDMQIFDALKVWLVSKHLSYRQLFWITGFMVFFYIQRGKWLNRRLINGRCRGSRLQKQFALCLASLHQYCHCDQCGRYLQSIGRHLDLIRLATWDS